MSVKKIIFILPYLNVNTTSSERFKSFIKAAEDSAGLETEVITIDYGISKSYFAGLSKENVDYYYPKNHKVVTFPPNIVQKLGFLAVDKGFKFLWRFFQLLHLLIYRRDIFYPGNIELKKVNRQQGFVFCSGSHFSLFTTANHLAQRLNFKLILDYRDPWTFGYNPVDGLRFVHSLKTFLGRRKELQLLRSATLITTVSNSIREFFPSEFFEKVKIIPNGSNFLNSQITATGSLSFNIVYAGTIYADQLKEEDFFQALEIFIKQRDLSRIRLEFLGANGNSALKKVIHKYGLDPITFITPRLNKEELLLRMNQASIFIHLRYSTKKHIISSKQAEYLNFSKPILLPISDGGDLEASILEHHAGFVTKNKEAFLLKLNELWQKFENGESLKVNHPKEVIEEISRAYIAKKFINELKKQPLNPPSL
nr:hypothetical protein [uncultured Pedobacter sp.]